MFKTYTFPSVFEGNNTDLRNVSPDLINGLKVYHNGDGYVIGNLALTEGVSPHKNINSAQLNGGVKSSAVGLDIGNATTIVSVFEDSNLSTESSIPAAY